MTRVKTAAEIQAMRTSGRILAEVLAVLKAKTRVGMTTKALAQIAEDETKRRGGGLPILGFENYPAVICISVNNEVVHGIPGERVLETGDLCTFDLCVSYDGMITDAAITVPVGEVSKEAKRLLHVTADALSVGIRVIRPGINIEDISRAIETRLRQDKLGIVEALCGHGVGHSIHEEPEIPNFTTGYPGIKLVPGLTLAIEPMATLGKKDVKLMPDHWTFKTRDGNLAAQFEHTILVTEKGCEILTK